VLFAFILSYSIMFTAGGWVIDRLGTRRGLALASVRVFSAALCNSRRNDGEKFTAFKPILPAGVPVISGMAI
jgi:hypothetical protein